MHSFERGLHRKDAGATGNSSKGSSWLGGGQRGTHGGDVWQGSDGDHARGKAGERGRRGRRGSSRQRGVAAAAERRGDGCGSDREATQWRRQRLTGIEPGQVGPGRKEEKREEKEKERVGRAQLEKEGEIFEFEI
jgi:hypothetical protein